MGGTTVLLAENSKDTAEIFTLDLPADASGMSHVGASSTYGTTSHRVEDNFLSAKATAHGPVIAEGFYGQSPSKKITFLRADSTTADLSAYDRSIDMVWIDGRHDYDTVRKRYGKRVQDGETRRMTTLLSSGTISTTRTTKVSVGSCVSWQSNRLVYTIGNTFLALCFPNADGKRFRLELMHYGRSPLGRVSCSTSLPGSGPLRKLFRSLLPSSKGRITALTAEISNHCL